MKVLQFIFSRKEGYVRATNSYKMQKKEISEEISKCTHCAVGITNDLSKLLFELAV